MVEVGFNVGFRGILRVQQTIARIREKGRSFSAETFDLSGTEAQDSMLMRLVRGLVLTTSVIGWLVCCGLASGDNELEQLERIPPVTGQIQPPGIRGPLELVASRERTPTPLPLDVIGLRPRSVQLELIAQQADGLSQKGYDLAGRGAYLAARAQFRAALLVLAQGLDTEQGTARHVEALTRAWTALAEAEDFLPSAGTVPRGETLQAVIARHETPILREQKFPELTALDAYRSYLAYAQDLFAQAVAPELAGSMALRGLGKLYMALAEAQEDLAREPAAQAVVFFQAALLVSPENYMAANDLGTLFARGNRLVEAKRILEYAAQIRPDPVILRNLSKVQEQLATRDSARWPAPTSHGLLAGGTLSPTRETDLAQAVVWMPPEALADPLLNLDLGQPSSTADRPAPDSAVTGPGRINDRNRGAEMPSPSGRGKTSLGRATAVPTPAKALKSSGQPVEIFNDSYMPQATASVTSDEFRWSPTPASPCPRCAVDGSVCDPRHWGGWERARMIAWEKFAQGEYVGRARLAHVQEYRLRVDDELQIVYRVTREETSKPYRLNVGDQIRVESASDPSLNRDVLIQPDGTITLLLLGQVKATGYTVQQLRQRLEEMYRRYYRTPAITVTPLLVNSKLEDLRATVDRRTGEGGQSQRVRVTPEGTISLPGLGSVRAQGLTLRELQLELNEQYRREVEGIEVIPILEHRAPRYVYVLGEVANPGRFELTGPTTVIQAISMAGGWKPGANLRQVVIFRRGDDWRLLATMLNLEAALHGNKATPRDEIWLSDSDVVLLPKSFIQRADDFIELVFTRGIYGVFPLSTTINFSKLSTI